MQPVSKALFYIGLAISYLAWPVLLIRLFFLSDTKGWH
jgi:hypothetical protein